MNNNEITVDEKYLFFNIVFGLVKTKTRKETTRGKVSKLFTVTTPFI